MYAKFKFYFHFITSNVPFLLSQQCQLKCDKVSRVKYSLNSITGGGGQRWARIKARKQGQQAVSWHVQQCFALCPTRLGPLGPLWLSTVLCTTRQQDQSKDYKHMRQMRWQSAVVAVAAAAAAHRCVQHAHTIGPIIEPKAVSVLLNECWAGERCKGQVT